MPWTEQPSPLPHPRAGLAAATCAATKPASGSWIYALGGSDGSTNLPDVDAYDTAHKTWTTVPPMPTERGYLAAVSHNGLLYALGGGDNTTLLMDQHVVYNPASNAWSKLTPLPTGRMAHAAVAGADGLIYVIGGIVYGQTGNTVTPTVDAYDPQTGQWAAPPPPMTTPRAALSAVALPDGRIFAIGGCNSSGPGAQPAVLSSVEYYDITTKQWKAGTSLPAPMKFAGAALGSTGLIFLIGGWDTQGNYEATVLSFDPTAGTWRRQSPLLSGPTASLAAATGPDGLIYAIGGTVPPVPSLHVIGDVEAYTYDKCDYIEYEIQGLQQQLAQLLGDLPDLPPQARAGADKELAALRARLVNLENELKVCRQ